MSNNYLIKLVGGTTREQVNMDRIHDALKNNLDPEEDIKSEDITIDKDDAMFIQNHLKCKYNKYQAYFGEYTNEMFKKL